MSPVAVPKDLPIQIEVCVVDSVLYSDNLAPWHFRDGDGSAQDEGVGRWPPSSTIKAYLQAGAANGDAVSGGILAFVS